MVILIFASTCLRHFHYNVKSFSFSGCYLFALAEEESDEWFVPVSEAKIAQNCADCMQF